MDTILLIAMLAGSAVDVGSTEYALSRGAHEINPLMAHRGVRVTINVAVPILIWRTTRHLPAKKQLMVAVPYIALKGYASYHAITVGRDEEP